jgi:calcium permeable stress-gated cation channel
MSNWYNDVLNTGKRRYGHPALTGVLPTPWLPLKKDQTLANHLDQDESGKGADGNAVVLTLRRRYSAVRKRGQAAFANVTGKHPSSDTHDGQDTHPDAPVNTNTSPSTTPAPSRQPTTATAGTSTEGRLAAAARAASHRLSFDPATGVITLPDGEVFYERLENGQDTDSDYGEASGETSTPEERSGEVSSNEQEGSEGAQGLRAKRHSTYFHHPERRRHQVPGAFPV